MPGFTIADDQNSGVKLIDYDNDDNSVVRLEAKDEVDEIYLIKGNDAASMEQILDFLSEIKASSGASINNNDVLQIPNFKIAHHRQYDQLIGAELINQRLAKQPYLILRVENTTILETI